MNAVTYCFPLSIQTVLPDKYREDEGFKRNLKTLQDFGFDGVELNIAHPDRVDLADVMALLKEFNLKLTRFASGLTAKTYHLSLSSYDPGIRHRSVKKCQEMINFMEGADAGIIIGFLKGPAVQNVGRARKRFVESLQQISQYAALKKVRILVEATNRYESAVANSLEETVELIQDLQNPFIRILPDTFHMNIEESDGFAALRKYAAYYESIHISDNTRYFPGFGAIKFDELIRFLKTYNYQGGLAIEGNIKRGFIEDVKTSMEYLIPLLS
jgi:D-psicose/D-tagatose/L-ribulose 3-epimerase